VRCAERWLSNCPQLEPVALGQADVAGERRLDVAHDRAEVAPGDVGHHRDPALAALVLDLVRPSTAHVGQRRQRDATACGVSMGRTARRAASARAASGRRTTRFERTGPSEHCPPSSPRARSPAVVERAGGHAVGEQALAVGDHLDLRHDGLRLDREVDDAGNPLQPAAHRLALRA
jgi:hypothetical protein